MEVGMMMQILSPGMEHCHEADPRAQMFGVGSDLQEGFGGGAKEHAINGPLVLESQGRNHLRQREDDVKVFDRQQLGCAVVEPRRAGSALALRAMAIAARAIGNRPMPQRSHCSTWPPSAAVRQIVMSLSAFLWPAESEAPYVSR